MVDHVVLDCECQRNPNNLAGGWSRTDELGLAVAVVYECRSDRFRVYGPDDGDALRRRLLTADRITTYNGERFDFPLVWGLKRDAWQGTEPAERLAGKSDDLLRRILAALGEPQRGWSLDAVCRATLGRGKIATVAHAPEWFQMGLWASLVTYCLDDVTLTRDLMFRMEEGCPVRKDEDGPDLFVPPWSEGVSP